MPRGQSFDEQDEFFAAALPIFVDRWRERSYQRVWGDVGEYVAALAGALLGKK